MDRNTDYVALLENLRKDCLLDHTVAKFLEKLCLPDRHFWFVNDGDGYKVKPHQVCACGKKKVATVCGVDVAVEPPLSALRTFVKGRE